MLSPTPGQKCVEWREILPGTSRPDDILKQVKPTLTPHYFRHNYVTLLYESGVDPLIAMKDRGPHRLPDHREHLHASQGGDAAQGFGQYGEGVRGQGEGGGVRG